MIRLLVSLFFSVSSFANAQDIKIRQTAETAFYVLMSCSVPDEIWLDLSKDLVRCGGTFLLRGAPKNNFSDLVSKINKLQRSGLQAPISLDPDLFDELSSSCAVPLQVLVVGDRKDQMLGVTSVGYFLRSVVAEGENWQAAENLLMRLEVCDE